MTPQLYNSIAVSDVLEPMKYLHSKYAENKRKTFAVGCSMGANILANLLGFESENCFIDAACVVQAPMKKWMLKDPIRNSMFGFYNYAMGRNLNKIMLRHEPVLKEHFKSINIDIRDTVTRNPPSIITFDDVFTAPAFGYEGVDDYYQKASCYHRMPAIRVPTLFLNAKDDPVCAEVCIAYDRFQENPNIVLGVTEHGGHLGYHESLFSYR